MALLAGMGRHFMWNESHVRFTYLPLYYGDNGCMGGGYWLLCMYWLWKIIL